jgi:hypothetical protein
MFPWLWFWAPQWHFPWSGDVAQRIDPDTHWFFAGIAPRAGHARIEERAFGVATYGRQIGLITDVLSDMARQSPPLAAHAEAALVELRRIATEIEAIKADEYAASAARIEAEVAALQQRGGAAYAALAARLRPLVAGDAAPKIER